MTKICQNWHWQDEVSVVGWSRVIAVSCHSIGMFWEFAPNTDHQYVHVSLSRRQRLASQCFPWQSWAQQAGSWPIWNTTKRRSNGGVQACTLLRQTLCWVFFYSPPWDHQPNNLCQCGSNLDFVYLLLLRSLRSCHSSLQNSQEKFPVQILELNFIWYSLWGACYSNNKTVFKHLKFCMAVSQLEK